MKKIVLYTLIAASLVLCYIVAKTVITAAYTAALDNLTNSLFTLY